MGRDRGDQALQRARRGRHDPRRAEQILRQRQQRPGRHALGRAFLQPVAQSLLGGPVEPAPAQVPADACELGALGRWSLRLGQGQHRIEAELPGEVAHRLGRHAAVLGREAAGGAQGTKLGRATQPVLGPACPQHLGPVRRREGPVPDQAILAGAGHERVRTGFDAHAPDITRARRRRARRGMAYLTSSTTRGRRGRRRPARPWRRGKTACARRRRSPRGARARSPRASSS